MRVDRVYRFGNFQLDVAKAALYRGDDNLNLRPKTFDTLVYLLENPNRLVTKDELIEHVWQGSFVTDDVLVQSIGDIRRALGDDARNPRFVKTAPRRGYLFIHDMEALDRPEVVLPRADVVPGKRVLLPMAAILVLVFGWAVWRMTSDQPEGLADVSNSLGAVVVMPFKVRTSQTDLEWLSQGIPSLIETALRQAPGMSIIGHRRFAQEASSRGWEPDALDPAQTAELARHLGARRLLRGNYIQLGDEIRINASLVDPSSGVEIIQSSQRATGSEEIFEAVDRISLDLAQGVVYERGLHGVKGSQLAIITTRSLEAYKNYVEGVESFLQGGRTGSDRALASLRQAIRIDPKFGLAHFKLAEVQQWSRGWGYSRNDPAAALRDALEHARELPPAERLLIEVMKAEVIDLDEDATLRAVEKLEEGWPLFAAEARLPLKKLDLLVERGQLRDAIEYGRTYEQYPYLPGDVRPGMASLLAKAYAALGRHEDALRYSLISVDQWPYRDSRVFVFNLVNLARAYIRAGRFEEAAQRLGEASNRAPGDAANLTDVGWGYYMLGRKTEALDFARKALDVSSRYGNAHHLEGWIELSRGRYAVAAASLMMAFELTPIQFGSSFHGFVEGDLPALYYAGVALQEADPPRATAAFRRLIEVCSGVDSRERLAPLVRMQVLALEALAYCRLGLEGRCEESRLGIGDDTDFSYDYKLIQARIHSVQGALREASQLLSLAVAAGARETQHLIDNPDFAPLRGDPAFAALKLRLPQP